MASPDVSLGPLTTLLSSGRSLSTTSVTPLSPEQEDEQFGGVQKDVSGSDVQHLEGGTDPEDLRDELVSTNLDQISQEEQVYTEKWIGVDRTYVIIVIIFDRTYVIIVII